MVLKCAPLKGSRKFLDENWFVPPGIALSYPWAVTNFQACHVVIAPGPSIRNFKLHFKLMHVSLGKQAQYLYEGCHALPLLNCCSWRVRKSGVVIQSSCALPPSPIRSPVPRAPAVLQTCSSASSPNEFQWRIQATDVLRRPGARTCFRLSLLHNHEIIRR